MSIPRLNVGITAPSISGLHCAMSTTGARKLDVSNASMKGAAMDLCAGPCTMLRDVVNTFAIVATLSS